MPIGALLGGALPGLIQAGTSLFGRKKRKREQEAAQSQFDQDESDRRNFDFQNNSANLENTAEDLTVNQQAAQFQAQQTDQNLSQGLDAITQQGGGGGGAQAIAAASLQASQGASATLAGQEQQNQQLRSQQAASNQRAEAQGADRVQDQEFGRINANVDSSGQRLGAANASIQQAKSAFGQGIGSALGGAAGAAKGGAKTFLQGLGANAPSPVQRRSPLKNIGDGTRDAEAHLERSRVGELAANDVRHDPNAQSGGAGFSPVTGEAYSPEQIDMQKQALAGRRRHKSDNRAYEQFVKRGYSPEQAAQKFEKSKGYAYGVNEYNQSPVQRRVSQSPFYRNRWM